MKTILSAAATAAALLTLAAAGAGAHATGTTLELVEHEASFKFVDIPPRSSSKPTPGDVFVINGVLLQHGRKTGTDGLVCTVTRPGKAGMSICTGTLVLPKGTITATGASMFATDGDTFAITGGTGAYAGARGTVVSAQNKAGDDDLTIAIL